MKFGPEQFGALQILLLGILVLVVMRFFKQNSRESQFRRDAFARRTGPVPPEKRKARDREQPARLLSGFVFTGQPHEILGVRKDASELEIRRAHRALIKRFHPDAMGPQGSREWYEAQKVAETLNNAREQMLKNLNLSK